MSERFDQGAALPASVRKKIDEARRSGIPELDLSYQNLIELPESIGQLTSLRCLDLTGNRLHSLPDALRTLPSLRELYLHGNVALGLPADVLGPVREMVVSQGAAPADPLVILGYYFRGRGNSRPLNEAKLILVGRGGVGKTSLAQRLTANQFNPDTIRTEGIQITAWVLPLNEETIRLHVWDFGGQEIMHATHQLFLTRRSIYLLVLTGRGGEEDADAEYWLRLIEIFGGDSPVIVVLNKISEHPFDLNRRALQQKYPVRAFVRTDCVDGSGIDELRQVILQEINQLEHLGDTLPASWFAIKDRLTESTQNYVSFDEYRRLCEMFGEVDPVAQDALAGYLHDLGVILNYRDDPRLQNTHILNPYWIINGIYGILNSRVLERQKGEFHLEQLTEILDVKEYPRSMHRFLSDLMKKFDLCFSFPDDEFRFLIPELLEKEEPVEAAAFDVENCLNFQYHYLIIPPGLMARFIVRTHTLGENGRRWRTGVILRFEANDALIKADQLERKVFISVAGPPAGRRRLLGVIRSTFESIHLDIPNLQPQEMVPLPARPSIAVAYQNLLVMEREGMRTFVQVIGPEVIEVSVHELLNGVDLEGSRGRNDRRREIVEAVHVYYSYSQKDERLRTELETHLKVLHRQGLIRAWDAHVIETGEPWKRVSENLERADIILFLVSADFLASDYCYGEEMRRALERHEMGKARIIPIIVRDTDWRVSPFSRLQALPKDGLPVTKWADRDSAWRNVARGIARAIELVHGLHTHPARATPRITRIALKNVRCFEDVEILLKSDDQVRTFTLLFGDNGVGKTTLLRSIALGLCDESAASAFVGLLPGTLLREGESQASIQIELSDSFGEQTWQLNTVLKRSAEGAILIENRASPGFPRDRLFVCGYGPTRHGYGTQNYDGYTPMYSLNSLFDYGSSLQNPELALRRVEAQGISIDELLEKIDAVLMLEPGATRIDSAGIRIRGPWGDFMPIGGLGDGFQATLGWIADLLGWAFFYSPETLSGDISGIVLIDELEQHLHPSWQREIIQQLTRQFPNIQFIGTSHAPMCALGMTALPPANAGIIRLRQVEGHVEVCETSIPKAQRADQILTSPLFGLISASGFDVSSDIEAYTRLAAKKNPSETDTAELFALGERISAVLGPYRSDLERRIDVVVRATMEAEFSHALESGRLSDDALALHIRHRIRKILTTGTSE